jgi:hypothetical protein
MGTDNAHVTFPPLKPVGLVVRDVEKTAGVMQRVLGWWPFSIVDLDLRNYTFRGKQGSCAIKVGLGNSGPSPSSDTEPARRLRLLKERRR